MRQRSEVHSGATNHAVGRDVAPGRKVGFARFGRSLLRSFGPVKSMGKIVVDVTDNLPKDQNLYINDLSLPQGQKTNWHGNGSSGWNGTHNNGLGIDVKMPTTDGNAAPGGMTYTSSSYSREKTIDLIKSFAKNKPEGYNTVVLFNDPKVKRYFEKNPVKGLTVWYSDGHDNHLHILLEKEKKK